MNRLKKLSIISTVWNIVLFFLLFFQSSLIYGIVEKKLFPIFRFIKPLLDDNFIEFIKNKAIIATVTIIGMILIEIILFFVVNRILQKKYKEYSELQSESKIVIQSKKSKQYYKCINIYLAIFILVFIFSIIYYALGFISISDNIDLSMNNKTINSIYNIAMETELGNLGDIGGFIDVSIERIRSDSEIHSFVVEILNFADVIYYINMCFYIISYLVLMFGIYRNTMLYFSLNKKEVSYE